MEFLYLSSKIRKIIYFYLILIKTCKLEMFVVEL